MRAGAGRSGPPLLDRLAKFGLGTSACGNLAGGRLYGLDMAATLTRQELEAAHCWEADDQVPRRPAMTAFRRRLRYHQGQWREANGHPIGSQPIAPRDCEPVRLVGSRLPLVYARETGANFVTAGAL